MAWNDAPACYSCWLHQSLLTWVWVPLIIISHYPYQCWITDNWTFSINFSQIQNNIWNKTVFSTHWGWVMQICVSNLTIIGPDNGLSPGPCQAIIRTNAGILLIEPLWTNFSEISIKIHTFSINEMHLKMSSGKWRPFCLGLNVLNAVC